MLRLCVVVVPLWLCVSDCVFVVVFVLMCVVVVCCGCVLWLCLRVCVCDCGFVVVFVVIVI